MNRIIISITFFLALAVSMPALGEVVFDNVTIITLGTDGIIENGRVVVDGDRIIAVGKSTDIVISDSAQIIDGTGKFLIPGLAEMHGHIPPISGNRQQVEDVLFLYVARGVTIVRGMLGSPGQLALRDQTASGEILGPTLYLAGPSFSGNSISSAAGARSKVARQAQEGWDLLKIHPGLTLGEYDAMAEAADEYGMRFAGHVPADVGLARAFEAGQDTIEHLDGYLTYLGATESPITEAQLDEAARMTIEAGSATVPTNALFGSFYYLKPLEQFMAYPELKYMPRSVVGSWERRYAGFEPDNDAARSEGEIIYANRMALLKGLADRGVDVLMGSDAPQFFSVPGFSIHREIAAMADAGMTPVQILVSGTVAPGRYFAASDNFGQIATGMRADLVLLNADPMVGSVNLGDQAGVMVRGRWLSADDISQRLQTLQDRYSPQ